ncbi:MAG: hypothetical protein OXC30_01390 [Alphaproteobacteria bacterium]|nr:hypothetical protein [Alphaproteobacteria bacterium]
MFIVLFFVVFQIYGAGEEDLNLIYQAHAINPAYTRMFATLIGELHAPGGPSPDAFGPIIRQLNADYRDRGAGPQAMPLDCCKPQTNDTSPNQSPQKKKTSAERVLDEYKQEILSAFASKQYEKVQDLNQLRDWTLSIKLLLDRGKGHIFDEKAFCAHEKYTPTVHNLDLPVFHAAFCQLCETAFQPSEWTTMLAMNAAGMTLFGECCQTLLCSVDNFCRTNQEAEREEKGASKQYSLEEAVKQYNLWKEKWNCFKLLWKGKLTHCTLRMPSQAPLLMD